MTGISSDLISSFLRFLSEALTIRSMRSKSTGLAGSVGSFGGATNGDAPGMNELPVGLNEKYYGLLGTNVYDVFVGLNSGALVEVGLKSVAVVDMENFYVIGFYT